MSTEAATIEAPTTVTPARSGRISWAEAGAKADAEAVGLQAPVPESKPAPVAEAKEPSPKKEPVKEAPKPKTALDALLAPKKTEEAPTPEATEEDPLKEFPLDAKEKNYAGLRKKAEAAWHRVKELEKQVGVPDPQLAGELEALRKTVADKDSTLKEREAALEEIKAKITEYKDAMVAVNIELDPEYRREFIEGRKHLVNSAGAKLKAYGGNPEALAEALTLPEGLRRDEAIEALTNELGDVAKGKIMRAVAEVESLDERRTEILTKPQASFEELQRKHSAQAQAASEQAEAMKKATFDKVAKELAASVVTLGLADETLEGGKEWNAGRLANNEAALSLLGNNTTPEQIVAASIKAADYDRLAGLFMETRKTLAEQAARLAEYEGAQPTTTGRKIPTPTKDEEMAKLTPGQRFLAARGSGTNDDF